MFDDVFGSADAVADDLYAHASEFAPDAVDADLPRGRLARKMSTDPWVDYERRRKDLEDNYGYKPGVTPLKPQKPRLDFSSEGTPVDPNEKRPDLSTEGAPEQPPAEPPSPSIGESLAVAGKAFGQTAVTGGVAYPLKIAATTPELEKQAYDQGGPKATLENGGYAQGRPQTPEEAEAAGAAFGVAGPYRKEIKAREREQAAAQEQLAEEMKTPVQERPLYKAGEAVQQWAEQKMPLTPEERSSLAGKIGTFAGGVAPALALTGLGAVVGMPEVGMALAGAQMGLQSAGQSFDYAISQGATYEQAARAAGLDGIAGGALGLVPLGAVLDPVRVAGGRGMVGWAAAKLEQYVKSGGTFAGIGEIQQWLSLQIASEYNAEARAKSRTDRAKIETEIARVESDPRLAAANEKFLDQAKAAVKEYDKKIENPSKYELDWERVLISFFGGGALGMLHPHGMEREEPLPPPVAPLTPAPGRPGPGAGPGGPTPGIGGPGAATGPAGAGEGFGARAGLGGPRAGLGGPGAATGAEAGPGARAEGAGAGTRGLGDEREPFEEPDFGERPQGYASSADVDTPRQAKQRETFEHGLKQAGVVAAGDMPFDELRDLYQTVDGLRTGFGRADLAGKSPADLKTLFEQLSALKEHGFLDDDLREMSPDAVARAYVAATMRAIAASGRVASYTTAKGSTYVVHEDGTTTRNKAARSDVGHEGDAGPKPRTERTVYVDDARLASALSAAGLENLGPKGARVIVKDGKASLLTWNETAGKWGRSQQSTDISVSDEPAVGKAPLELWKKATDVPGYEAYRGMHAGNAITEIGHDLPPSAPRYRPGATPGTSTISAFGVGQMGRVLRSAAKEFMESSAVEKFVEGIQDLSVRVRKLEEDVRARMMGALPDSRAFYVMKRLFPGKRDIQVRDFNAAHMKPLFEHLKDNQISAKDFGDYLYARHALERNNAMGTLYPAGHPFNQAMTDGSIVGGSGMSANEARAIRQRVENGPKAAAYRDAVRRVKAINDFTNGVMVAGQLEKQSTVNDWNARYSDYVPLSGFDVTQDENPGERTGGKFSVRGKEVKQAFGRRSKAANPLEQVLNRAYRTIERAEKNRYMLSLANALSHLTPADRQDLGIRLNRGEPKKVVDRLTGLVRTVDNYAARFSPNSVHFKLRGESRYIHFDDRSLAEAVDRMSPDQLGMFQGLLNLENKFKALWTHYSPDFLARHFLARYPIEGTLNAFETTGVTGVHQYIKDAIPFLGAATRAIFAREKGQQAGWMGVYWDEMKREGGAMMFRNMRDMDMMRESLKLGLRSLRGRPLRSVGDKFAAAREAMDHVTNTLDNALRLAAYVAARKKGATPQQAALVAREATVDFQLKGGWSNWIGLWFPFGNVAIQTGTRLTKAVSRSKTMRGVFMGTMLAGFLISAFNYLVGGDDKDGIPFFEKIPEWDRRLNLIILNPFDRDDQGRPQPIKIPMPYNWAVPLVLGYGAGGMAFGKMKLAKVISMMTHSVIEGLTPVGGTENKADLLSPELLRPAAHLATNRDAFNRPIHIDPGRQHGPAAYSGRTDVAGRVRTGQGWKTIAESINDLTGGRRGKSGLLDFYPEDYREVFDYVAGTQSRLAQNVYQTGKDLIHGKRPEATHVPLERVFHGTDYDAANRSIMFERSQAAKHPWERADTPASAAPPPSPAPAPRPAAPAPAPAPAPRPASPSSMPPPPRGRSRADQLLQELDAAGAR